MIVIAGGILAKLPDLIKLVRQGPTAIKKLTAETEKLTAETESEVAEMMGLLTQTYTTMVKSQQSQIEVSEQTITALREKLDYKSTKLARSTEENQTLFHHNRRLIVELSIARKTNPTDPHNGGL